eukprot:2647797-Prymnesium_polylepis.1
MILSLLGEEDGNSTGALPPVSPSAPGSRTGSVMADTRTMLTRQATTSIPTPHCTFQRQATIPMPLSKLDPTRARVHPSAKTASVVDPSQAAAPSSDNADKAADGEGNSA